MRTFSCRHHKWTVTPAHFIRSCICLPQLPDHHQTTSLPQAQDLIPVAWLPSSAQSSPIPTALHWMMFFVSLCLDSLLTNTVKQTPTFSITEIVSTQRLHFHQKLFHAQRVNCLNHTKPHSPVPSLSCTHNTCSLFRWDSQPIGLSPFLLHFKADVLD